MSKGIKNRLISGLLTFAMVLSFVPSISFSRSVEVDAAEKDISTLPNITMLTTEIDETGFTSEDALKAARLQAVEKDAGTTGLKLVASGQKSGFTTYMWHYSGGYWGANYKPIVYDSELKNSKMGIGTISAKVC